MLILKLRHVSITIESNLSNLSLESSRFEGRNTNKPIAGCTHCVSSKLSCAQSQQRHTRKLACDAEGKFLETHKASNSPSWHSTLGACSILHWCVHRVQCSTSSLRRYAPLIYPRFYVRKTGTTKLAVFAQLMADYWRKSDLILR